MVNTDDNDDDDNNMKDMRRCTVGDFQQALFFSLLEWATSYRIKQHTASCAFFKCVLL